MSKRKNSLVLSVALSDREAFPNLPTKKQAKNIYNKARNKLIRQGVTGELLQTKLIGEIRSELFTIQEPYKTKSEINLVKLIERFHSEDKCLAFRTNLHEVYNPCCFFMPALA